MRRKFIIDTDPGVDDIEALLFLLSRTDIDIVAITTCCGNGPAATTYTNTLKVLSFIECHHIPVYRGIEHSSSGFDMEFDYFFGDDAMGEADLPHQISLNHQEMDSPEALIHYCRKHRGDINLVAIGPLTNIAIAYMFDHKFPTYLSSFTSMSCDRNEITIANCCDYAEFNARCDPQAIYIVFNKFVQKLNSPCYLIDWDLCRRSEFPLDIFDRMVEQCHPSVNSKKKQLIKIIENKSNKGVQFRYTQTGFVTADIFAAIVAYDPSIIKKSTLSSLDTCVTEGPKKGHVSFKNDNKGKIILVDELDMPRVIDFMLSIITN